jgi:hypothetical protein
MGAHMIKGTVYHFLLIWANGAVSGEMHAINYWILIWLTYY